MNPRVFLIKITSSFFGIGYLPLIPGTFGSVAGMAVYFLVVGNQALYFTAVIGLGALGYFAADRAESVFKKKDARFIVIDEVVGMLISLLFLPFDYRICVAGFILFRFFDTLKPFPAARLEELKGGAGVMCDDIVAGIYTNAVLQLVLGFASFKIS